SPLSLPPSLSSLPPLPRPPLFPYTTLFRSQALSSQTHGLFIGGRQQHQKLFPADAANNSCGIRQSLQLTGQLGEHSVAGLMPPAVVDRLEVIDIDHNDAQHWLLRALLGPVVDNLSDAAS